MYFDGCRNLNELKVAYKKLALEHHPDMGGDVRTMQEVNAEYDKAFAVLKNLQNAEAERPDSKTHKTTETPETPEEFRAIIEALLRIEGIEVELCGSWLWVGGDTYPHRAELKAAGCAFSGSKKKWYWRHPEDDCRWSRGKKSMAEIRAKYGSERIGRADERERDKLPA